MNHRMEEGGREMAHEEKARALVQHWEDERYDLPLRSDQKNTLIAAVAAALAEQYQTGWNEGSQAGHDARYPALEAELAQLRAKLEEAEADRINIEKVAGTRWTKLKAELATAQKEAHIYRDERDSVQTSYLNCKAERDAAYVKGLERAKGMVPMDWHAVINAIQAEIDKAKK